jgi:hypothetical protein
MLINSLIRTRTRHFRHAYLPTHDNMYSNRQLRRESTGGDMVAADTAAAMKAVLLWRFVRLTSHMRAGSLFSAKRRNSSGTKLQESAVRHNLIRGPLPCKTRLGRGAGRRRPASCPMWPGLHPTPKSVLPWIYTVMRYYFVCNSDEVIENISHLSSKKFYSLFFTHSAICHWHMHVQSSYHAFLYT